jgi:putative metalloprotease GCWU000323_01603
LLGYDHIEEEDKAVMRRREEEILSKFNYIR